MSNTSLLSRNNGLAAASIIGAYANVSGKNFRQADIRFVLEVFVNWIQEIQAVSISQFQNTQLARYMQSLIDEGFARKVVGGKRPQYRLNRSGLLELVQRISAQAREENRSQFLFCLFFLSAYGPRVMGLIRQEGIRFPHSIQLELENLLDPHSALELQISHVQRAAASLKRKIDQNREIALLTKNRLMQSFSLQELIAELEKKFPYALVSEKRFTDLSSYGTEKQLIWELTEGNLQRLSLMWEPAYREKQLYLEELKQLQRTL